MTITADAAEFRASCGEWLDSDPVLHTYVLGALAVVGATDPDPAHPPVLAWLDDGTGPVAAAVWAPPHPLALAAVDDDAARRLAGELMGQPLGGVLGPAAPSLAFAEGWAARQGVAWQVEITERQYRLDAVVPPRRRPEGVARLARPDEDDLLVDWAQHFMAEANPGASFDTRAAIEGRRRSGGRYYLWDDGEPRCLVSHTVALGGVPRIGPVYTPPQLRGRGYAQALIAAVCDDLLREGATAVTLYADATNTASNAAYLAIGFRAIGDSVEIVFRPSAD